MAVIPRSQLPEDGADFALVEVEFDYLEPNSEESFPGTVEEVMDYVRMESADVDQAERSRLKFIRTAKVGEYSYWLWEYKESGGCPCYVAASVDAPCSLCLADANGLNPEQFLLAEYYDEVYWG